MYTPQLNRIAMRLLFVSQCFCRSISVRGRWNTPNYLWARQGRTGFFGDRTKPTVIHKNLPCIKILYYRLFLLSGYNYNYINNCQERNLFCMCLCFSLYKASITITYTIVESNLFSVPIVPSINCNHIHNFLDNCFCCWATITIT